MKLRTSRQLVVLTFISIMFYSCDRRQLSEPSEGFWLAELEVQDNKVLPFNFEFIKNDHDKIEIKVHNADEIIQVEEIRLKNDSIIIKMPVYEGYISGTFTETMIEGEFIKESLDRVVPFKAIFGRKERFRVKKQPNINVSGIWETEFSPNTVDASIGKGIFTQNGKFVSGTYRTTIGDKRFLDGVVDGDSLKLSTFDGAHAFLFMAKVTDSTMEGTFYSGNHFKEPFVANRNESFELPNEDTLTYLKPGYDKLAFSFPDLMGNMVSLEEERFNNKVVIVQIMGTWCPNCLDETKFLVNYLGDNLNLDIEIVALAFEYAKTKEGAYKSIKRLKKAIGVEYPILLAQYASSNKTKAGEKLPMLNHVLSYPTTIFIDKNGQVRRIHTGFNGPATGDKHYDFKKEFDTFVTMLSNE